MRKLNIAIIALLVGAWTGVAIAKDDASQSRRVEIRNREVRMVTAQPERPYALTGRAEKATEGPQYVVKNQGRAGYESTLQK